jgi:radical SAM family uncharacterized protein
LIVSAEQLDRLLLHVQRPGRYVGGEVNAIRKDWSTVSTRVCLAFPDVYELGMSNLGLAVLYHTLNQRDDVLVERTFCPWPDMAAAMRQAGVPLYSLETYRAVAAFDILGVSLPYEILYTNLLELLALAGLPLRSVDRDARHPLVVAGGHATFNPEPVADFIDAFVIGEGEEAIVDLVEAHQTVDPQDRQSQLEILSQIPGVYVPRFYDATHNPDGTLAAITPNRPSVPPVIQRRFVASLPPPPTRQVVPNISVTHDRGVIEIQRGCTRGCRFCHAGFVTRPMRERPLNEILTAVDEILEHTGYEEIALLSLSSADYSHIEELVTRLTERADGYPLTISLPSLRIESFSVELAHAVSQGRRSGFTFAPEAGTERLRKVINKDIPTGQMLEVAREVFGRGWRTVKLYFMIGLPGEEPADLEAMIDLSHHVHREGRRVHGRSARVNVSVSTFVPKPHTPFQWAGLAPLHQIRDRQELLRQGIRGRGLNLSWSNPQETLVEALLSRGDRRLGAVIEGAWQRGARFDGWGEQFAFQAWTAALADEGLDPHFYAHRARSQDELLPWDLIDPGVRKSYLWHQWELSRAAQPLPDCRTQCTGCGILTRHGGLWAPGWTCPPSGERGG